MSGYNAPTANELRETFESVFQSNLDETLDFSRDTVEGQLAATVGLMLGDLAEASQALYDQRRITNATGLDVDDIVALVGIERQSATSSTVELVPAGTNGTPIGASTEVKGPNGFTWVSIEDGEIGAGPIIFECETVGPVDAPSGSSWDIVTPIKDLDSFSNPNPASPGRPRESDQNLIERRNREFAIGTTRRVGSLRSALRDLDFIDASVVVENRAGTAQTVEGINLDANSIGIVVFPSSLTTEEQDTLAETIYQFGPEPIGTNGDETVQIESVDGTPIDIQFSYATIVNVNVEFDLEVDPPEDKPAVETAVEERTNDYFDNLSVGEDVRYDALIGYVADIDDWSKVQTTGLKVDSDRDNVSILTTELATPTITFV